jgi:glycogen debranching enzyme
LIRRDTRHVTPGQRMDTMDALLFYDLIRHLRAKRYDSEDILKKAHLVIADITFNSIFIRANEQLSEIAKSLNRSLPDELAEAMARSRQTFEQFWDSYSSQYCSRNYKTGKLLRTPSIGALLPLYSGCISPERAAQLVNMLAREDMFKSDFPVASVPLKAKQFDAQRYWQGPTWINTNWLIADGLERYGFKSEAKHIRDKSLQMIAEHGFYEYFSPLDGAPAGAKDFSWTAALTLDWLA